MRTRRFVTERKSGRLPNDLTSAATVDGAGHACLQHRGQTPGSPTPRPDRLGLPIGSVLREESVQMRLVRRQRAEEKAQKVPVRILFPMLLCIFPALFIVIIGPGAIRMIDTFSHLNG